MDVRDPELSNCSPNATHATPHLCSRRSLSVYVMDSVICHIVYLLIANDHCRFLSALPCSCSSFVLSVQLKIFPNAA